MSDTGNNTEWFLARDGKQHGPLNDTEMRKVVEGGFLRPTDLVWRQGFANWMAASTVFPMAPVSAAPRPPEPQAAPAPAPSPQPQAAPQGEATAPDRAPRGPSPAAAATNPAAPAPAPQTPGQPAPQGGAPQPAVTGYPQGQPTYPQPSAGIRPQPQPQLQPQQPLAPQRPMPGQGAVLGAGPGSAPNAAQQPTAGTAAAGHPMGATTGPRPQPGPMAYNLNPQAQRAPGPQPGAPGVATGPALTPGAPPGPQIQRPQTPGAEPKAVRPEDAWRAAEQQAAAKGSSPDETEDDDAPRRRFPWLIAVSIVLLAILGGAGLALYKSGKPAGPTAAPAASDTPTKDVAAAIPGLSPSESKALAPDSKPITDMAIDISGTTADQIDKGLQKSALWKLLKTEFADWYNDRVAELVRMRADQQNDKAVQSYLTRSLVDLRRKNAEAALSSSPARLRFVATSFIESLTVIAAKSTDACFAFISQGESAPRVLELAGSADLTQALQVQFRAIFEAAIEGRKAPSSRGTPQRNDFDMLAFQLAGRGWTPTDLQLFSDAGALAKAKPERVCKMVQDWFHAQLGVADEAVQARLLSEALKPVVAG